MFSWRHHAIIQHDSFFSRFRSGSVVRSTCTDMPSKGSDLKCPQLDMSSGPGGSGHAPEVAFGRSSAKCGRTFAPSALEEQGASFPASAPPSGCYMSRNGERRGSMDLGGCAQRLERSGHTRPRRPHDQMDCIGFVGEVGAWLDGLSKTQEEEGRL